MIRIGMIGLGHNGQAHLAAHQRVGRSEIVAVCDRREDLLDDVGTRFGCAHRTTDPAALCARDDLDAITIHTGDPFHAEPFRLAVASGKHVFCEKPLANTVEDIQAICSVARDASPHLKLAVGYVLRFNPVFEAIAAACHAGRLGQIYYQEADYIHNLLYQARQTDPLTGTNWYLEHEQPVVGGGSHALDLLRWFCRQEIVEVSGYANHVAFPEMKADDCQVALFRFDDGGIAKVASLYGPRGARPGFNNLRIYGPLGSVERDSIALATSPDDQHPELRPVEAERIAGHPYDPEIADWLDAIEQDRPPRCDLFDGANSTLACLLAVRATRTGRAVEVPVLRR